MDAQKNKESEFRKWFYFDEKNNYRCFLDFSELPKLNLDYMPARKHVIDSALFWLNKGIDSIRIDHAIGPSLDFWKEFRAKIKKEFPNTSLLGEVWTKGIKFNQLKTIKTPNKYLKWLFKLDFMKTYTEVFDGCIDFSSNNNLQEYVKGNITSQQYTKRTTKHYAKYATSFLLLQFLDNHDMNRLQFYATSEERYQKAVHLLFEQKQPIIIYQGDELKQRQIENVFSGKSHADLTVRQVLQLPDNLTTLQKLFQKEIKKKTGN